MRSQLNAAGHRRDGLWIAFLLHRLSGVALACFLPLHFLALGLAINGEAKLDDFLRWTADPLVKLSESAVLFLLIAHMLGGMRLLAIESLPWRHRQKPIAAAALLAAALAAIAYMLLGA
jgi:fumarate reductase subunit D